MMEGIIEFFDTLATLPEFRDEYYIYQTIHVELGIEHDPEKQIYYLK